MSTTIIMLTSFSYLMCPLLCHILAYLLWNEWQFGQFGLHTWWWRVVFNPKLWRLIQQWVESVNSGNKHLRLLVYTTQYMLPEKQLKIFFKYSNFGLILLGKSVNSGNKHYNLLKAPSLYSPIYITLETIGAVRPMTPVASTNYIH